MIDSKREIKDVIYLMALQGLNYVAPLIVFPYLMKVLGAEKFGYIGFSLSVIQYLMLIVDFGFNLSATKKIALAKNNQQELNDIFWATMWSKIGLLAISFVVLLIFAFAVPRFTVYRSTMLIMFLMVISNTFSFVWLFQGLGKIRVVTIINTISKLLILPITFLLVKSADDYLTAAFIQSMVYVAGSVITIFLLLKKRYVTKWIKYSKDKAIFALKDSYPIFLSIAATSIYTALFAIVLGYFSTPIEVGKYTAAEKIMRGFAYLVFVPISQSFYPRISAMSVMDKVGAKRLVKQVLFAVATIMLFIFCLMFFFSGQITSFLGKDYSQSDTIFKIMAFIPFFIGCGGVLGQLGLLAIGDEHDKKRFQRVYFVAGMVALVLVFVLIPKLEALGATIALLVTELTVFIGMVLNFKNQKKSIKQVE